MHGCRESHGKNRAGMNIENAEAAMPEASRSSDLSEEMNGVARRPPKPPPAAKR